MCGIVGYVGSKSATDFLLEGLRRLEYRGYDSAGLATLNGKHKIAVVKVAGRLSGLVGRVAQNPCGGTTGIGHTRWATHGAPNDANAHPHVGGVDVLALAHNGVIENHAELRSGLVAKGYAFRSDTDTEVIAHLIADALATERDRALDSRDPYAAPTQALQTTIKRL